MTLAGTIFDAGSDAISNATIRAIVLGPGGRPLSSRTYTAIAGDTGMYRLDLQRGNYRVVVSAEGYAIGHANLVLDRDRTQDFRLAPAARIVGTVIKQGILTGGAQVRLDAIQEIGSTTQTTLTGADGRFTIDGLTGGTYQLSARKEGFVGRIPQRISVAPGGVAEATIELNRGLTIAGLSGIVLANL